MNTFLLILLGVLLLGILIAVHEGGHFVTARLTHIPVREFAIGMGPKLLSHTSKKTGIVYSLRAIPIGGFCAFYGEDDPDVQAQDDPRAFSRQKVWKRLLTVLMGPVMNFVLALVVLFGWYWIGGFNTVASYDIAISSVTADSPAEAAGFQAGDLLLAVNGTEITDTDSVIAATNDWGEDSRPHRFTVRRGEETLTLSVSPAWNEKAKAWQIGIIFGMTNVVYEHHTMGPWRALCESFLTCVQMIGLLFEAVVGLFRGRGWDEVSGPVGIFSIVTDTVRAFGFEGFLNLLVAISVNLGFMNLLPIPGLDGSRIIFMLVEAVCGKPVPPEKEAIVHLIGMILLFGLMIFLTVRDVGKLF